MGQRLVVEIVENEEPIAAIYFHWSAYFSSTCQEMRTLVKDILKAKEENKDILLGILEGLEARGGGIGHNPKNLDEAEKRFPGRPIKNDISRNNGLMYLGKEEIEDTIDEAEGMGHIYVDTQTACNDMCYSEYFSLIFDPEGRGITYNGKFIDVDPEVMDFNDCIRLGDFIDSVHQEHYEKMKGDRNNGEQTDGQA